MFHGKSDSEKKEGGEVEDGEVEDEEDGFVVVEEVFEKDEVSSK